MLAEAQALAHLGIWEWDIPSNELCWSDELYQILGLAPGEVPASFEVLLSRVHTDDLTNVKSYFARARRERSPLGIEYRIVRLTGEVRTLQARVRSTFDEHGALVRLSGTDQDITETKELAARLVFSDRMVSIGTLAGGVAHEINNPLATISANLGMLAEAHDDASTREALQAVERIRNIVRGLMAFGRVDDNHRQPLEIRHRARLNMQLGGLPYVNGNEARLGHLFINLLVNAAEAIPEGQADRNEIRVITRTDSAGWAVIEIQDSGAGIPRDVQHRIFDPFFTTKPLGKGTGLGLSICHGVVRSLGGEITFRSELGKGSTFVVALPPATEKPRKRSPRLAARGRRRGPVRELAAPAVRERAPGHRREQRPRRPRETEGWRALRRDPVRPDDAGDHGSGPPRGARRARPRAGRAHHLHHGRGIQPRISAISRASHEPLLRETVRPPRAARCGPPARRRRSNIVRTTTPRTDRIIASASGVGGISGMIPDACPSISRTSRCTGDPAAARAGRG
jgi:PAS domain S-box-containing protein